MPELPDVEIFKRRYASTARGRTIAGVTVRDAKVLRRVSGTTLRRACRGRRLGSPRRHGKFLFVPLGRGRDALVFHFGMTGFLEHYRKREEEPAHARVVFELRGGSCLAFDCKRKLGEIDVASSVDGYVRARKLGPDALAIRPRDFSELLRSRRRGTVKSALMDQSLLAGIGNVYSDEILFRARLHPDLELARLEEKDVRRLHRAIGAVLRGAVRYGADPERVPRSWLLPHRRRQGRCPRCRVALRRIRSAGRAAWVCERCMRKREPRESR